MICPFCKSNQVRVEHTRAYDAVNFRWRRCEVCGRMFTTEEVRSVVDDEKTISAIEKTPIKG